MSKNMDLEKKKRFMDKKIYLTAGIFVLGILIGVLSVKLPTWMKGWNNPAKKEVEKKGYNPEKIVKLGAYDGVKVSLVPTEEELQQEIEAFLEEHVNYEQKKGAAEDGDKVHATVTAFVGGDIIDSATVSDFIDLGAGMYLYEVENGLIGMKTGEVKKVRIKVPKGYYGDKEIDGKEAEFRLSLDYVCGEAILPDYNDEFVSSVTSFHTVASYNNYLKQRLAKENQEDKEENAWAVVLEKSEVDDGDYPKVLLSQQRKEILQGYYDMATINGTTRDEVFREFGCKDEQDFIDRELEGLAKDGAKEILVSEAIAARENIFYTEKDYQAILSEEYDSNEDLYKNKQEYEKKNREYLKNTALMHAVKKWINKRAKFSTEE